MTYRKAWKKCHVVADRGPVGKQYESSLSLQRRKIKSFKESVSRNHGVDRYALMLIKFESEKKKNVKASKRDASLDSINKGGYVKIIPPTIPKNAGRNKRE